MGRKAFPMGYSRLKLGTTTVSPNSPDCESPCDSTAAYQDEISENAGALKGAPNSWATLWLRRLPESTRQRGEQERRQNCAANYSSALGTRHEPALDGDTGDRDNERDLGAQMQPQSNTLACRQHRPMEQEGG